MGNENTHGYWAVARNAPKRQNRFLFEASIAGTNIEYFVKTSGRPGYTVTEAEHRFLNHKYYYPGIVEWETLDVTLVDPVDPSMTLVMMKALDSMGWLSPENVDMSDPLKTSVISKMRANDLGSLKISALDANGVIFETWTLTNAWIQAVKFNDFDYSGDDLMDTTLTIRFDWATLTSESTDPNNPMQQPGGQGGVL